MGDEYQPCKLQKLIYDYKFCNGFRQTNTTTEITCKPRSDEGRYLVLAKGNVFQYESNEPLNLCEIRVYGVATAEIVIPRRPDIQNETLPDISKSNFVSIFKNDKLEMIFKLENCSNHSKRCSNIEYSILQ